MVEIFRSFVQEIDTSHKFTIGVRMVASELTTEADDAQGTAPVSEQSSEVARTPFRPPMQQATCLSPGLGPTPGTSALPAREVTAHHVHVLVDAQDADCAVGARPCDQKSRFAEVRYFACTLARTRRRAEARQISVNQPSSHVPT